MTHRCDQQVRLTSMINMRDSQVRSTGATHKCDRLSHESEVCKFAKFESLRVQKFALKNKQNPKTLLNESG